MLRALTVALLFLLTPTTPATHTGISGLADSQCLASAIHYEARGEPLAGRRAVLDTIAHRMLATGKGACSVVLARGQFSWSKRKPLLEYDEEQREKLTEVIGHRVVLKNKNHLYFYSGSKPAWAEKMSCRKIYQQTFCRGK